MAISIASSATNGTIGITIAINKPTGLSVGELLFAHLAVNTNNATVNPPAGWTTAGSSNHSRSIANFYKIADAADVLATDFTFSQNQGTNAFRGIIMRITGINTTTPIDSFDTDIKNSVANPTFLNIDLTPTYSNSMLIMTQCGTGGGSGMSLATNYAIATNNPTWTTLYNDSMSSLVYALRTQTSATGNTSFTGNNGVGDWDNVLTIINPVQSSSSTGNMLMLF